jgi:hypothetical protein
MICKICESPTRVLFQKIILGQYPSNYHQCIKCDFIQTDEPVWLEKAYSKAITALDIGLLNRNFRMQNEVPQIIDCAFPEAKFFLDYAGGYGIFVRLMRDKGFNFFRQDIYCDNLFAKEFDIADSGLTKFDLLTSFEVLEHFNNPLKEIETMFQYSDSIICSTELIPENNSNIENWWYLSVETGQHIAFYSNKTMLVIAEKFNKNYYQKGNNLHIFTPFTLNSEQKQHLFGFTKKNRLIKKLIRSKNYIIHRESLLWFDYQKIKKMLNE